MSKKDHILCWIRRDLRLSDHSALAAATNAADRTTIVFVFDTTILDKLKDRNDRRVNFIHDSLVEIDHAIQKHGSQLVVLHGDPISEIPKLAKELKVDAVYTNRDYEPSAKSRDKKVEAALAKRDIVFQTFKDQVVFESLEIQNKQGRPYKVFTPYKRAWLSAVEDELIVEQKPNLAKLTPVKQIKTWIRPWSLQKIGFEETKLWLVAGARAARKRLKGFEVSIAAYAKQRDFPAVESGTSGLSVHLRFGTISVRELVRAARQGSSLGHQTWLSELIWREFYQMILDQFPHVISKSFKPEYDSIRWPGNRDHFKAWCEGKTGYPIVDAAMRHLNTTGWMHNRLRMIVASFLTKDLLIDWRQGEDYFARQLLDYDLAANNGGWQWCASTGCDAQPYFRIFNPITQSQRFDREGAFIKTQLPALKNYASKYVHFPSLASSIEQAEASCIVGKDYPAPIVDHKVQRRQALALLETAQKSRKLA